MERKRRKRLTLEDREKIRTYIDEGLNCIQISKKLDQAQSTITREIRINGGTRGYIPVKAQAAYEFRMGAPRGPNSPKCKPVAYVEEEKGPTILEHLSEVQQKLDDLQMSIQGIINAITNK